MGDKAQFDDVVSLVGGININTTVNMWRGISVSTSQNRVNPGAIQAAKLRAHLVAVNAARLELRNQRSCGLLQLLTGQEFGRDETRWWDWWLDRTEQQLSGGKQLTRLAAYQVGLGNTTRSTSVSCFSAATPVHTKQGLQPIVDIKPGDYVLCQSIASGEVAYRVVLNTTVWPAKRMLIITAGQDELEATLGHPFWVVGEGWKMAKELRLGDQLQSLGGIEVVRDLQVVEKETSAYNLVVAEFANYFVGKSGILAHDISSSRTLPMIVPGIAVPD